MRSMKRDEVPAWRIKGIGLPEYVDTFVQYGVDGSMLEDMDDEVLEHELKIGELLHRKKILKEIKLLQSSASTISPAAATVLPDFPQAKWMYSTFHRNGLLVYHMDIKSFEKLLYSEDVWADFSASQILDERIYIIGGVSKDKQSLNQMIQLTVSFANSRVYSKRMASMISARSCPGTTTFGGKRIMVTGGYLGGDEPFPAGNECEVYDSAKDKWEKIASLSEPRAQHAMCVIDNRAYCFGGCSYWPNSVYSGTIECCGLTPFGEWTMVKFADLTAEWSPRRSLIAVPIRRNEVLIFGGQVQNRVCKDVFVLDTDKLTMRRGARRCRWAQTLSIRCRSSTGNTCIAWKD